MDDLIEVLKLRRSISQSATAKYSAILHHQVMERVFDSFVFRGASRTGRWASRSVQFHNARRPKKGLDPSQVIEDLHLGLFDELFGGSEALEILGGLIRSAVCAPEDYVFIAADLSSIESNILGWLSGDEKLRRIFRENRDPYKDFATHWLRKLYEEITKEERTLSKPPALGCGYGLGALGLGKYAESMGIELTEEQRKSAVKVFRKTYAAIPRFWRWIETAFVAAINGQPSSGFHVKLSREGDMVVIWLPSGRGLYYHKPWIDEDRAIQYMGMNQYTRKWEPIKTYGARLVENVTQAVACDVFTAGLHQCEKAGLDVVLHLHDGVLVETPGAEAEQAYETLIRCMTDSPPWAPDLVLRAEGYISKRFGK